jgi:hypothetical protein
MGGDVEDRRFVPEQVLGAVAVMDIPIDDHYPLTGVDKGGRGHGHVVQEAETHGPIGPSMVARGAGRHEDGSVMGAGGLYGHQSGPGSHAGVLPGGGPGVGVGVEFPAAGCAELLESLQMGRGMHPDQALGRSRGCRHIEQVGAEVEVLDAAHGSAHSRRALGMSGMVVVTRIQRFDDDQHGASVVVCGTVGPADSGVTVSGSVPKTSLGPRGRR